jgi:hypothetical protein
MKKHILYLFLWVGVFLCLSTTVQAQTPTGIVVVEQRAKTTVYDIRVIGLRAPAHGQNLDDHFRTKEGIFTASTNVTTGVCRVEALSTLQLLMLEHIVQGAGFQVAKSFNE